MYIIICNGALSPTFQKKELVSEFWIEIQQFVFHHLLQGDKINKEI